MVATRSSQNPRGAVEQGTQARQTHVQSTRALRQVTAATTTDTETANDDDGDSSSAAQGFAFSTAQTPLRDYQKRLDQLQHPTTRFSQKFQYADPIEGAFHGQSLPRLPNPVPSISKSQRGSHIPDHPALSGNNTTHRDSNRCTSAKCTVYNVIFALIANIIILLIIFATRSPISEHCAMTSPTISLGPISVRHPLYALNSFLQPFFAPPPLSDIVPKTALDAVFEQDEKQWENYSALISQLETLPQYPIPTTEDEIITYTQHTNKILQNYRFFIDQAFLQQEKQIIRNQQQLHNTQQQLDAKQQQVQTLQTSLQQQKQQNDELIKSQALTTTQHESVTARLQREEQLVTTLQQQIQDNNKELRTLRTELDTAKRLAEEQRVAAAIAAQQAATAAAAAAAATTSVDHKEVECDVSSHLAQIAAQNTIIAAKTAELSAHENTISSLENSITSLENDHRSQIATRMTIEQDLRREMEALVTTMTASCQKEQAQAVVDTQTKADAIIVQLRQDLEQCMSNQQRTQGDSTQKYEQLETQLATIRQELTTVQQQLRDAQSHEVDALHEQEQLYQNQLKSLQEQLEQAEIASNLALAKERNALEQLAIAAATIADGTACSDTTIETDSSTTLVELNNCLSSLDKKTQYIRNIRSTMRNFVKSIAQEESDQCSIQCDIIYHDHDHHHHHDHNHAEGEQCSQEGTNDDHDDTLGTCIATCQKRAVQHVLAFVDHFHLQINATQNEQDEFLDDDIENDELTTSTVLPSTTTTKSSSTEECSNLVETAVNATEYQLNMNVYEPLRKQNEILVEQQTILHTQQESITAQNTALIQTLENVQTQLNETRLLLSQQQQKCTHNDQQTIKQCELLILPVQNAVDQLSNEITHLTPAFQSIIETTQHHLQTRDDNDYDQVPDVASFSRNDPILKTIFRLQRFFYRQFASTTSTTIDQQPGQQQMVQSIISRGLAWAIFVVLIPCQLILFLLLLPDHIVSKSLVLGIWSIAIVYFFLSDMFVFATLFTADVFIGCLSFFSSKYALRSHHAGNNKIYSV